jgi:integrase/recombinase XerD
VLPAPFVNASGFAFGCLLPVRVCGERVGHGGLDSERLGEPGELEDAQDARSADCQSERSTGLAEPFDTADGLGPPVEHALISLLALNGLRVSEATGADIEHLGLDRGHRTLTITRKGGKVVTVPLAPRTARAIDLAVGERTDGPVFLGGDGQRLDRHGAGRIVRKTARRAGIAKTVTPHTLRHAFITAAPDAGVPLRDVQEAASHADPRTTMRYDRARGSLDRHATYIVAAYVAGAAR